MTTRKAYRDAEYKANDYANALRERGCTVVAIERLKARCWLITWIEPKSIHADWVK